MKKKILIVIFLGIVLGWAGFGLYGRGVIKKSVIKNDGEYVVLLHGLGRTSFSMQKIGVQLVGEGYKVVNIGYPSRSDIIENLVDNNLKNEILEKCTDKDRKINFVTHSMGGIMARYLLANNYIENINKVVMLAPPNKGSKVADKWSGNKMVNYVIGPSLKELTTNKNSFVNNIKSLDCKIGIIAGEYDGKVSIENAKLDEMSDFVTFPKIHTWIMNSNEVIKAVINFLAKGEF